jgi:hypothetical protein
MISYMDMVDLKERRDQRPRHPSKEIGPREKYQVDSSKKDEHGYISVITDRIVSRKLMCEEIRVHSPISPIIP